MGYVKRGDYEDKKILTHLQESGKWHKILHYACDNACPNDINKGLDIHLRSDSVHIYYKGGRILEIRTDVLNLDSNYFYRRKDYDDIPRTHMELLKAGNYKELKRRRVSYHGWTPEKASVVFDTLEKSRDNLFGIKASDKKSQYQAFANAASTPERYFKSAMKIMDDWSESLKGVTTHEERMLQQKISLLNHDKDKSDFIVIDIEFSVSDARDCPYRDSKGRYKHPRFDIIAYQPKKNNRLAVIELKKGLGAVGWTDDGYFDSDTKSGVLDHLDKFNATVGNDNNYVAFIKEIQGILDMKISLGILPKDLATTISTEKPEFMLAYAGEEMDQFSIACKKANLSCICIEDEGNPILKERV
jgi:hypothetical protein